MIQVLYLLHLYVYIFISKENIYAGFPLTFFTSNYSFALLEITSFIVHGAVDIRQHFVKVIPSRISDLTEV